MSFEYKITCNYTIFVGKGELTVPWNFEKKVRKKGISNIVSVHQENNIIIT